MEQNFAAILQVISSTPARSQSGWPAWDPLRLPSSSWQDSIYCKGMHYPVVTVRLGWPPRGHCIMAKAGSCHCPSAEALSLKNLSISCLDGRDGRGAFRHGRRNSPRAVRLSVRRSVGPIRRTDQQNDSRRKKTSMHRGETRSRPPAGSPSRRRAQTWCSLFLAPCAPSSARHPLTPSVFHFIYDRASVGGMGVEVLAIAGSWQREGDALPRHRSDGPIR